MKCPHCRKSIMQMLGPDSMRIRVHGPLIQNLANQTVDTRCFWCKEPLVLQAFFPKMPPEMAAKP